MNLERFLQFSIMEQESDLWIGLSPGNYPDFKAVCARQLRKLRSVLLNYIQEYPSFQNSLVPLPLLEEDPPQVKAMKEAALMANTGPMAAVAGMIAEEMLFFIQQQYSPEEIVVENGGDVALSIKEELTVSVYAGTNEKFSHLGLVIPQGIAPCGVCTSSGRFGHSLSFGNADSLTVCHTSAAVADAWATSLANRIKSESDIEEVLRVEIPGLLSVVGIAGEKMGIRGGFRLALLN
jgi:ApbE superfamily uncharacterized protein (UPF0280 family)